MFEFLKRLWPGRKAAVQASSSADVQLDMESAVRKTRQIAAFDMDTFSPGVQEKLYQKLAEKNGFPIFEGEVRHGYSKADVRSTGVCPRCGAPTRQYCAHFIYATDKATRVMMMPAGFFCSKCPTVIVDEGIIAAGVKNGFTYQGVIGVDFLGRKDPVFFETWNGVKPVYVFDENEECHGMEFGDLPVWHSNPQRSPSASQKKKQRRRMAKQSRRRNR
jgi:hypothetical protein